MRIIMLFGETVNRIVAGNLIILYRRRGKSGDGIGEKTSSPLCGGAAGAVLPPERGDDASFPLPYTIIVYGHCPGGKRERRKIPPLPLKMLFYSRMTLVMGPMVSTVPSNVALPRPI